MTDALGTVAYQYDTRDRLTQEQRTLTGITGTFTTAYVYNYKGDMTQMTYPSGRVVNFNYASAACCIVEVHHAPARVGHLGHVTLVIIDICGREGSRNAGQRALFLRE